MSRLEIYAFNKETGDSQRYAEATNAWGGAYYIWERLSSKYGVPFSLYGDDIGIWKLADTDKLSKLDNIVLKFTFDRIWVKRENTPLLTEAVQAFVDQFVAGKQIAQTLVKLLEVLERAAKDETIEGLSFNQTSVNENPWWVRNKDDDYDDGRPYNIKQDKNHWELFETKVKAD